MCKEIRILICFFLSLTLASENKNILDLEEADDLIPVESLLPSPRLTKAPLENRNKAFRKPVGLRNLDDSYNRFPYKQELRPQGPRPLPPRPQGAFQQQPLPQFRSVDYRLRRAEINNFVNRHNTQVEQRNLAEYLQRLQERENLRRVRREQEEARREAEIRQEREQFALYYKKNRTGGV